MDVSAFAVLVAFGFGLGAALHNNNELIAGAFALALLMVGCQIAGVSQ